MPGNQTRRRRKRRGTQGGRIDMRPARGRPRNREEAKARARSRAKQRTGGGDRRTTLIQPSWRSAANRGVVAALIFLAVLTLILSRPFGESVLLCIFMLALYIPMGYYIDRFVYNRRLRALRSERS